MRPSKISNFELGIKQLQLEGGHFNTWATSCQLSFDRGLLRVIYEEHCVEKRFKLMIGLQQQFNTGGLIVI